MPCFISFIDKHTLTISVGTWTSQRTNITVLGSVQGLKEKRLGYIIPLRNPEPWGQGSLLLSFDSHLGSRDT